ncbi:MAG: c-type cytochrome [Burkholderiales bacterium]
MNYFGKAKTLSLIALGCALAVPGLAFADRAAGQAKAKQVCAACHGENGDKPLQPEYAILAGQHRDYLIKAINDYKSGARKNAIMGAQVEKLSRQEILDLAEWFSTRPGPLAIKH